MGGTEAGLAPELADADTAFSKITTHVIWLSF
jgi:hypothetical protein